VVWHLFCGNDPLWTHGSGNVWSCGDDVGRSPAVIMGGRLIGKRAIMIMNCLDLEAPRCIRWIIQRPATANVL
jgi:hypothetical protein